MGKAFSAADMPFTLFVSDGLDPAILRLFAGLGDASKVTAAARSRNWWSYVADAGEDDGSGVKASRVWRCGFLDEYDLMMLTTQQ